MAIDDLYKRACEAVERPNYAYAVHLLREVLRANPAYPDARNLLRATERRRLERKAVPLARVTQPLAMAAAAVRVRLGKPAGRVEAYEDYLEKHPNSFWGLHGIARAMQAAGLKEDSVPLFKEALRAKPDDKTALREVADVLLGLGQTQEALKFLSRLSTLLPEDRDLYKEVRNLEASDHMAAHKMDETGSFRDLIRDKDMAAQLEQAGRMAVSMSDLERQVTQIEAELQENPTQVSRILRLAQLYQDVGHGEKADDLLKEKRELLPNVFELREKHGDVKLALFDKAIAQTGEALAKEPGSAELKARLRELRQARCAFGIQEYTWRQGEHPTDRGLAFYLGELRYDAGQYNEAIAAFQTAAQDARYGARTHKALGRCFLAKKQHDLALAQFAEAIKEHGEMDQEGKEFRYLQGQAYEAMGRTEDALNVYKQIYSQDITFRDVARKVDALGHK